MKGDEMGERILLKLTSRKMVVFIVGTVLLCLGQIDQDAWRWVAAVAVGAVALQNFGEGILLGREKSDD